MKVCFSTTGWSDYTWWLAQDRKILKRINVLIADIARDPYDGIGKPEALRHDFAGFWSRRITEEHRLIYQVVDQGEDETIEIAHCRYHYER